MATMTQGKGKFSLVVQSCLTLCDPMNCSTPSLPVHHQLPEFTQTHVHHTFFEIQKINVYLCRKYCVRTQKTEY